MSEEARLYLGVAMNTAIVYAFLVVAIRLFSRRQLGQLSALDLLILVLLGSAVETAMVEASTSLKAGLVSAATLLVINRVLTFAMLRSRRFSHVVGSGPLLLVHDGKFVEENLRQIGMTKEDVAEAIRGRECGSIKDLRYAVFEPNGEINIVYKDSGSGDDPDCGQDPLR